MNDEQRAALVDGIAMRIDNFCEHVGYGDRDVTRDEAESYVAEVEEALADRAVPTVDDDAVELAENAAWAKLMRHSDMGRVPWANNLAKAAMEYGIEAGINAAAGITPGDAREGGEGE